MYKVYIHLIRIKPILNNSKPVNFFVEVLYILIKDTDSNRVVKVIWNEHY